MQKSCDERIPITKKVYPIDEAIEIFKKQGMDDKVSLLKYRRSSEINVYKLDDFYDYFYGYMLPNTSYIEQFQDSEVSRRNYADSSNKG